MKTKKFMMFFVLIFLVTLFASQVLASKPETYPLIEGKRLGLAITGDPSSSHKVFVGFKDRPGNSEEALVVKAG